MLTIWDTKHIIFIASFNPSKQQYKLGTIEVGCKSLQWVCLPYSFECRSSGLLLIYALSLLQRVNGQGALQALLEEGSDIASQQDNAGSGGSANGSPQFDPQGQAQRWWAGFCRTLGANITPTLLGFPGGSVIKHPPATAEDTGSVPGLGRSHMHAREQLSSCTTTVEPEPGS